MRTPDRFYANVLFSVCIVKFIYDFQDELAVLPLFFLWNKQTSSGEDRMQAMTMQRKQDNLAATDVAFSSSPLLPPSGLKKRASSTWHTRTHGGLLRRGRRRRVPASARPRDEMCSRWGVSITWTDRQTDRQTHFAHAAAKTWVGRLGRNVRRRETRRDVGTRGFSARSVGGCVAARGSRLRPNFAAGIGCGCWVGGVFLFVVLYRWVPSRVKSRFGFWNVWAQWTTARG